MALVRMDIETVVVGGGQLSSLVVLRSRPQQDDTEVQKLPIRIGTVEASSLGMVVNNHPIARPMTHDLFVNSLKSLGVQLEYVTITHVEGIIFYAELNMVGSNGTPVTIDSRPSDALALALRVGAPIFADERVLDTASYPDYEAVRKTQQHKEFEEFHDFVEGLSPEDFRS